jgi:membrane protease YdiL (CAAX protease family)
MPEEKAAASKVGLTAAATFVVLDFCVLRFHIAVVPFEPVNRLLFAAIFMLVAMVAREGQAADFGLRLDKFDADVWWTVKAAAILAAALFVYFAFSVFAFRVWHVRLLYHVNNVPGVNAYLRNLLERAVIGALVEEAIYRGIVFPPMRKAFGRFGGILINAFLFTALYVWVYGVGFHWQHLIGGIIFAYAFDRTNSLVPPIVLHFLTSAVVATWGLAHFEWPDKVAALIGR